jgi:hypothetical protein
VSLDHKRAIAMPEIPIDAGWHSWQTVIVKRSGRADVASTALMLRLMVRVM